MIIKNALEEILIINDEKPHFKRNKDYDLFFDILTNDKERYIILNTRHNTIEITYYTGNGISYADGSTYEKTDMTWFGVNYAMLDELFNKYGNCKSMASQLIKFCLKSKSRSYWKKIKDTTIAREIIADTLGSK